MQPIRSHAQNASVMQVSDLVLRVGDELVAVAQQIEDVLTVVGPMLAQIAARERRHIRHLQEFDHIQQKLRGLADFLDALGPAIPDHWSLDASHASQRVTLAALSARLTSTLRHWHADEPEVAGDFEMF